jgi:hypothetical protein
LTGKRFEAAYFSYTNRWATYKESQHEKNKELYFAYPAKENDKIEII